MNRAAARGRAGSILLGLAALVSLAGCGSQAASSAAQPTPTPTQESGPFFPTAVPYPTATLVTPYARYVAWRSGMVLIVADVVKAYKSIGNGAADSVYDPLSFQGHLQDARDAISDAQDRYSSIGTPSGYSYIMWAMGQGLQSYMNGINTMDQAIANNDLAGFRDGVKDLYTGNGYLRRINALTTKREWLLWLKKHKHAELNQKSGSA